MSIKEWLDQENGTCLDWDNSYGYQCVDLINFYFDAFNLPGISGVGYAYEFWTNAGDEYIKIDNTTDAVPQVGDIIIWSNEVGYAGHVAIASGEGDTNYFVSLDQNWPLGSCTHYERHSYWGVIGWLRLKNNQNTMTEKEIQEKLWAEAGTKIYDIDTVTRWAMIKLTGRFNYPGSKVIHFTADSIFPDVLTKEKDALKTSLEGKITALTNTYNTNLKIKDSQILELQKQIEELNEKPVIVTPEIPVVPEYTSYQKLWMQIVNLFSKMSSWFNKK